jgi:predicted metal-dependent phosphotriesterase family hydrolase
LKFPLASQANDVKVSGKAPSSRRSFLQRSTTFLLGGLYSGRLEASEAATSASSLTRVRTVLGPISPDKLGVTLMHEHAPVIDWSELYETPPAPLTPIREKALTESARFLNRFHEILSEHERPGAIVEVTPIRVGRYPQLLLDLARRTPVHLIASTGFWCEALAPQHPWAVRLSVAVDGIDQMAKLFIREITEGMEDPGGDWGERYTQIRAGIIKIGTSTYLRPSERVVHIAASRASRETGCPISTHTTDGGGLEQAQLLLQQGAKPEKVIIGHQGYRDDRKNEEAHDYHRRLADLGVNVQFDRVGGQNYRLETQARQIQHLIDKGYINQILVSHDRVPYFYSNYTEKEKIVEGWTASGLGFNLVSTGLVGSLLGMGASSEDIRTILIKNPARVLAF